MTDVNVMDNNFHVASYCDMPVWYEGGDQKAIAKQVLHTLFEGHKLHCSAASCLVPLKCITIEIYKRENLVWCTVKMDYQTDFIRTIQL